VARINANALRSAGCEKGIDRMRWHKPPNTALEWT
jgi:hypothetical protein